MLASDLYKTIDKPSSEVLFKDKGSKFFGYAFPVNSEEEAIQIITDLKVKHHKARHWCYAYKIGVESESYRVNDDGEPNNSAGQPIYGQILSFEVTNILVVVVRYFGGVKLGVGGLINAYKTAAKLALENARIVEKTLQIEFQLTFSYENMNKVMRLIKERGLEIKNQQMELECVLQILVRKSEAENIKNAFENLRCLAIEKIN